MLSGGEDQLGSFIQVGSISLGCIRYPKDAFHHVASVDLCVTNPPVLQKFWEVEGDSCQDVVSWVLCTGAPVEINSRPMLQGIVLKFVFRTSW